MDCCNYQNYQKIVYITHLILNQAGAGLQPARAWFLRIVSVHECLYACVFACVHVCPPLRLLTTSGVMWCDVDPI